MDSTSAPHLLWVGARPLATSRRLTSRINAILAAISAAMASRGLRKASARGRTKTNVPIIFDKQLI
jgi:hypothetical protein